MTAGRQSGAAAAAGEQALSALRYGWGDAYRIGYDEERGYWAARRDGLGGDITATGPGELFAAVTADHAFRPVRPDRPDRPAEA